MNKPEQFEEALQVLTRAREQAISEIAACNSGNGGVGRAANYTASLVNIDKSISIVRKLMEDEKMARVRNARKGAATPEVAPVEE